MQLLKRIISFSILVLVLGLGLLPSNVAYAQQAQFAPPSFTLLPELRTGLFPTEVACELFLDDFENAFFFSNEARAAGTDASLFPAMGAALAVMNSTVFGVDSGQDSSEPAPSQTTTPAFEQRFFVDDVLACAVKTGRVKFAYIPFFLTFFLSLGTIASGTIAMLFVIIGGYQYMFSGLSDGKEGAKKTIAYALGGMVLSSFAWIIVQVVISFLNG